MVGRGTGEKPERRGNAGGSRSDASVRGQSEVLGVVLLLAITAVGTGLVVAFGSTAIDDSRTASEVDSVEHAMTQFDSKASLVALGGSSVQTVSFGRVDGDYDVRSGAGSIEITHVNYDGSGNDYVILPETSLGAVVYENGGTAIAYQGGGVWRHEEGGGSTMVSPPEFHYRGSTLTLPIVRVLGSGGASGSPTGRIEAVAAASPVYPSGSTYPDGSAYDNPLESGRMEVTVQSRYYEAWAEYFESRTTGAVTVDDTTDPGTVTVELVTTGTSGPFDMPGDGGGLDMRGLAGDHSISEYAITLRPDDTDSADFANLQWSMYAEQGDRQLEIHLRQQSGNDCDDIVASVTVYYSADGGDSYHGWYDDDAYTSECFDADGDGADDEVRLVAGFVDADDDDPELEYQSLSRSELIHFNPGGASLVASPDFDEHDDEVDWEPQPYSAGSTEEVDHLIAHYFALLGPGFDLRVDDKNSNTVSEDASSGTIEYPDTDRYVTFLHVTENEVRVEVN